MSRLIETIRLENGEFGNLHYHQSRMDKSRQELFGLADSIDLKDFLSSCPMPSIGLHKVRLVYDIEIQSVQISTYIPKIINRLKIIFSNSISYNHKLEDRTELETLFAQRGDCDDIIIVKDNKITDASFANLVFKKDDRWFTPKTYLLNGTMRQQLLERKMIFETDISVSDLKNYQKVKLINSMLQFDAPEIDVSQIVE